MFDGKPYLEDKAGCFVECQVTVGGVTRSQLHPILNYKNKPIVGPNCFEINTSMQRALAKAISLHGLGLYIYSGEDIPMSEKEALQDARDEITQILKDRTANEISSIIYFSNAFVLSCFG